MKKFSDTPLFSMFGGPGGSKPTPRCADSHPPLKIRDGIVVYGGAAADPKRECDIHVSLEGAYSASGKRAYPWHPKPAQYINFYITDTQAPSDPEEFMRMIAWLAAQLEAGRSLHVGCIGGHGRTGTLLAALVKQMTGNADAIQFVREHYCKKAVESQVQVDFLHKHFGINKEAPSKPSFKSIMGSSTGRSSKTYDPSYDYYYGNVKRKAGGYAERHNSRVRSDEVSFTVHASIGAPANLWGLTKNPNVVK